MQRCGTTKCKYKQCAGHNANAQQNGDSREAARMLAVSAYGASVWKTTTPSTVQSTLSDTLYQIAAKLALGVPPVSLPSDCSSCHKADACETDPATSSLLQLSER